MNKKIYLGLMIIGVILPYTQFVPWSMANGMDLGLMAKEMFANQIAAGIAIDALTAAVILMVFMALEQKRRPIKLWYLPVLGVFIFGLAFALPCYLYLLED
jgi:hypothetical protein